MYHKTEIDYEKSFFNMICLRKRDSRENTYFLYLIEDLLILSKVKTNSIIYRNFILKIQNT